MLSFADARAAELVVRDRLVTVLAEGNEESLLNPSCKTSQASVSYDDDRGIKDAPPHIFPSGGGGITGLKHQAAPQF